MQLTTGLNTYLYHFEAGDIRIACPISERLFGGYRDLVTPYGLSGFAGNGDYPMFSRYWEDFVKGRGYVCGYIGLNPLFENSTYFDLNESHRYNSIYVLDLTPGIDEIFANLSTNRKRQLKRWESISSNIVLDRGLLVDFFLDNYEDCVRRVSASPVYRFSRETLSFLLSVDNVLVVGAGSQERVEAVSVFGFTAHAGDFLLNVSLPEGRRHSAALLWYAVSHLKSLQIPLLNVGGGVRENDGVAQFKQRFGGRELPLRCLKQVYDPGVFAQLCLRVNADPDDRSGYFPPYRQP